MHLIPERLTLHLTSIHGSENPERFHIVSSRAGRGIGPNALDVPFNPINPYFSINEAKEKAAKMLGVDYEAIELVDYLQPRVAQYEASDPGSDQVPRLRVVCQAAGVGAI